MNLGQAVAVCLYELVRAGKTPRETNQTPPAKARELEIITQLLFGALRSGGYVKPRLVASTEENVRRMVRRMQLNSSDAEVWLGMLRQIAWKLAGDNSEG